MIGDRGDFILGRARLLIMTWVVVVAGCNGTAKRTVTGSTSSSSGEPVLDSAIISPGTNGSSVEPIEPAATSTPKTVGFVDRHPLLRKPQQYFNDTNSNKAVKTAAATVVGVPAGIVGEIKQIVLGKPSSATY